MGQKTHPKGFRVGIIEPWESTWYAKRKDYPVFVKEDDKLRKYIKKRLYAAGISKILIDRKAQNVNITVVTAKPGIVVGRGVKVSKNLELTLQNSLTEQFLSTL